MRGGGIYVGKVFHQDTPNRIRSMRFLQRSKDDTYFFPRSSMSWLTMNS